jgi:hypothetical protein
VLVINSDNQFRWKVGKAWHGGGCGGDDVVV